MDEYATYYHLGREAARDFPWPAEWRLVFQPGRRVRGQGRMNPASAAGWMRGFRHACMERSGK